LEKAGQSIVVIDQSKPFTASKIAAGIINPVTGRRMVKTWMIEELLNFIKIEYRALESELGIQCLENTTVIDFFPSVQMRQSFLKRQGEDDQFLQVTKEENYWRNEFNYELGWGSVSPAYLVDLPLLLSSYRNKLKQNKKLLEENFEIERLFVKNDGVQYKDIRSNKIIFCDGIESANNHYFKNLPFAPNKGEALIIETSPLSSGFVFKKGISIVHWEKDKYWVGSSYEWEFSDDLPTKEFRERTEYLLGQWLRHPFKIIDHVASIRPATLERRPFVGFHPQHTNLGILNGMGTKGCTLGPYFAKQLADHITSNKPLMKEADIYRFKGILTRPPGSGH
ncbi:MAG: FAD-dependent oxidoreductase, partial [Bacteroidetes bacterium]